MNESTLSCQIRNLICNSPFIKYYQNSFKQKDNLIITKTEYHDFPQPFDKFTRNQSLVASITQKTVQNYCKVVQGY
jgi:hypothetical protein